MTVFGDSPRALAVSNDGSSVYAAIFHSGTSIHLASRKSIDHATYEREAQALEGIWTF